MKGYLVFEDGTTFEGLIINAKKVSGEIVFNTGMTGYQEIATDPSYCNQIVTLTYPLIGNYGTANIFDQSRKPYINGLIVSELCDNPNNHMLEEGFREYLNKWNIPCLYNVDTREITRKLRDSGALKGVIMAEGQTVCKNDFISQDEDEVQKVTTDKVYYMENNGPKVVVVDYGIKLNILRSLHKCGCNLIIVPADTTAKEILSYNPDGIFLSNGPGNPECVPYAIETLKELIGTKPIFGICLGHQLLALALGAKTYKLKFGHRGSNHPVKDLKTQKLYITSQNHGYAVDEESLDNTGLIVTHRAVNDDTVEGLEHTNLPVFSVQYHPEAAPGPEDNLYIFEQFVDMMRRNSDGTNK